MELNTKLRTYPSVDVLVSEKVASRTHAKDASLFDFSDVAYAGARDYMGWTDLATQPPCSLAEIQAFADEAIADGISQVILIAEGGSVQAPMTMAQYHVPEGNRVSFFALDLVSPANLRYVLSQVDFVHTLIIVSSKSGGTIEPNTLKVAVWDEFAKHMSAQEISRHFVAITDAGSSLEHMALEQGWRKIFFGEPTVGGRFSALSVFGLVPAALIGLDLEELVAQAARVERACAEDAPQNPAIQLAAFLFDNQQEGRAKFSLVTPPRAAGLCLWVEQLVAESTGKDGKGELPNTEPDVALLAEDDGQRCVITYVDAQDESAEAKQYVESLGSIDARYPRVDALVDGTIDLVSHFVIWEYATAFCGWLMRVCPFDQPDVASAKAAVLDILAADAPAFDIDEQVAELALRARVASTLGAKPDAAGAKADGVVAALRALFASYGAGDYVAIDAFLPTYEGRLEALEGIRHDIAETLGAVTCLEIGPRYLHSIGQLQKGGPNNGVFLILSCEDEPDIAVEGMKAPSLGALAQAQAAGDFTVLSDRGRRVVELRLPNHKPETLVALGAIVREALSRHVDCVTLGARFCAIAGRTWHECLARAFAPILV